MPLYESFLTCSTLKSELQGFNSFLFMVLNTLLTFWEGNYFVGKGITASISHSGFIYEKLYIKMNHLNDRSQFAFVFITYTCILIVIAWIKMNAS